MEKRKGSVFVQDPVRRKWVLMQPEEWVRQLLIQHLLIDLEYPLNRISAEVGVRLHGEIRRADLVVYDAEFKPWMVVECKAPEVHLTQQVVDQVGRYNLQLHAPWLCLCNGEGLVLVHMGAEGNALETRPDFPPYGD
jgi:hypothetical protein